MPELSADGPVELKPDGADPRLVAKFTTEADDWRAGVGANGLAISPKGVLYANQTFHVPSGGLTSRIAGLDGDGPRWLANPNLQVGGTVLFATKSKTDKDVAEIPDPRGTRYSKSAARPAPAIWRHNHFPIYPWAMVAGKKHLAVAGPPAEVQPDDPWAGFEGRAGGELHILDSGTGKPIGKIDLDSPPVWDGMAVADGRLYIAKQNGSIECFGE